MASAGWAALFMPSHTSPGCLGGRVKSGVAPLQSNIMNNSKATSSIVLPQIIFYNRNPWNIWNPNLAI